MKDNEIKVQNINHPLWTKNTDCVNLPRAVAMCWKVVQEECLFPSHPKERYYCSTETCHNSVTAAKLCKILCIVLPAKTLSFKTASCLKT